MSDLSVHDQACQWFLSEVNCLTRVEVGFISVYRRLYFRYTWYSVPVIE